jgi:hypothetical protein
LAAKLNIRNTADWNNVTTTMVRKEGGSFIDTYYNGSVKRGIGYSSEC